MGHAIAAQGASIALIFLFTEAVLNVLVRTLSLAIEDVFLVLVHTVIESFCQPLCTWRSLHDHVRSVSFLALP